MFLGSENGFTEVFNENDYCAAFTEMTLAGNCGEMVLTCTKRDSSENEKSIMHFFRFNCSKKKFELYEQYEENKISGSIGIITSIDLKKMSIVIKDKKDSKDISYKLHKAYASGEGLKYLKTKFKAGDPISFYYVTINNKIVHIREYNK